MAKIHTKRQRRELFKDFQFDAMQLEDDESRPIAVKVEDVSMQFSLKGTKGSSLKEVFINALSPSRRKNMQKLREEDEFWALKNINLTLRKGDRLGILGLNGAGKSTLLKTIAGVYKPTTGTIVRNGVLAPLLELGAGFDMQYTARENIYLYGAILGYRRDFIDEKFDDIVEFAELRKFLDSPVKNFSSGMRTRLGFSICTAIEPDILILDEVLAVGDAKFRRKSEKRIIDMFGTDVTVMFVSHSLAQVQRICNKAIILDHGELIAGGDIEDVAPVYERMTE